MLDQMSWISPLRCDTTTTTVNSCNLPVAFFAGGLERVKRSKALRCFVPIFSSKQYVKALQASRNAHFWGAYGIAMRVCCFV